MKITLEWLKKHNACKDGYEWSVKRLKGKKEEGITTFIQALIDADQLNWARWAITKAFDYKQRVRFSVFAAELAIKYYEAEHPSDCRPREAIEAAKKCIDDPSQKNKAHAAHAYAAADAAYAAAYADADAYAADADAAYAAVNAANAAAYAAANAAADAAYAAADASGKQKETMIKILKFGLTLFNREM